MNTPRSAPAAATASAPVRLYKLAELPAEIRQQLPTLSVGGAMHSENAGSRMLILSGQVYREGEQPAPGLTLERIQLRSAVLAFKGYRFEIAKAKNGESFVRFVARNGQTMVRSETYTSKASAINCIESIKKNGPGAPVEADA